jgi:hypothetical protein
MELSRSVEHSVLDHVSGLFTSPPDTLLGAWNVYGEDEFVNPLFAPTAPFVWILDADVRPTPSRLPLILIEREPYVGLPFELGTEAGTIWAFRVDIFGRNRGERGDLAHYVYQHLVRLGLYDYATDPRTFVETVTILRRMSGLLPARPDAAWEGTLQLGESILFDFQTQS